MKVLKRRGKRGEVGGSSRNMPCTEEGVHIHECTYIHDIPFYM